MRVLIAYVSLLSCAAFAHPMTFLDTMDRYWQQWAADKGILDHKTQQQPLLAQLLLAQHQRTLAEQQQKQHEQRSNRQLQSAIDQQLPSRITPKQLHESVEESELWTDEKIAAMELLSKLHPEDAKLELSTNGNNRGVGVYFQVLPDEDYGDEPIYSLGGTVQGGEEPIRLHYGLPRLFG